ncbi:hypothetical protein [Muribacter muris]|uniref:hypothetical protein n=1 Tax=Muribacter muris TaxID=67855 RepID=UPI001ADDCFE5|nr:hypothetical protein [Muribacter muris]
MRPILSLTNEAAAQNDNFMPLDEIGQGSYRKHMGKDLLCLVQWCGQNGYLLRYPFNPNQSELRDTAGYKQLEDHKTDERFGYSHKYLADVIKGFNEKQALESSKTPFTQV